MAMKFHKPEDRTPGFGVKYILFDKKGNWQPGWLKEIKTTEMGDEFIWREHDGEEIMSDITHYMPIEIPKDKDFKL